MFLIAIFVGFLIFDFFRFARSPNSKTKKIMSFRGRSRPRFGFRGAISSSRRSSTPEPRSPPPPTVLSRIQGFFPLFFETFFFSENFLSFFILQKLKKKRPVLHRLVRQFYHHHHHHYHYRQQFNLVNNLLNHSNNNNDDQHHGIFQQLVRLEELLDINDQIILNILKHVIILLYVQVKMNRVNMVVKLNYWLILCCSMFNQQLFINMI